MTAITVSDLRFKLNDILAKLVKGDSFTVQKAGKSVAELRPINQDHRAKPQPVIVADNIKYQPIKLTKEAILTYDYTIATSTPADRHSLPEITVNLPIRH